MRIYFPTDSRLKSVAKKLKDLAPEFGLSINLRNAREAASRMLGYRNWEEARTLMATRPPTPLDDAVPPAEAEDRRRYQAARLRERLSIPYETAEAIVERLKPSGPRVAAGPADSLKTLREQIRAAELACAADGGVFFMTVAGMDIGICVPLGERNQPGGGFLSIILDPRGRLWVHIDYVLEELAEQALREARAGNRDYDQMIGSHSYRELLEEGERDLAAALSLLSERAPATEPADAATIALADRMAAAFSGRLDYGVLARLDSVDWLDAGAYTLLAGGSRQPEAIRRFFEQHPSFLPLYHPHEDDIRPGEAAPEATPFMKALAEHGPDWERALFAFANPAQPWPEPDDLERCGKLLRSLGSSREMADTLYPGDEIAFLVRHHNAPVPESEREVRHFQAFFENATSIANLTGRSLWDLCVFDDLPSTWQEAEKALSLMTFTDETEEARSLALAKAVAIAAMDPAKPLGPQRSALIDAGGLEHAKQDMDEMPYVDGLFGSWKTQVELSDFERNHGTVLDAGATVAPEAFRAAVLKARELVSRVSDDYPELHLGRDPGGWLADLAASTKALLSRSP